MQFSVLNVVLKICLASPVEVKFSSSWLINGTVACSTEFVGVLRKSFVIDLDFCIAARLSVRKSLMYSRYLDYRVIFIDPGAEFWVSVGLDE